MAFTIVKKPDLDTIGSRWVEFAPGAKLLVGSIACPLYRSHEALVRRHIAAIDQQARIGAADFEVGKIPPEHVEDGDGLFADLAARHLIKGWEGVDVEENPGVPAEYTPELGRMLLDQIPGLYFLVLQAAVDVAQRREEQKAATVGKRSRTTAGKGTTRAKTSSRSKPKTVQG